MTTDSPHLAGHPPCSEAGEHVCAEPSGRYCFECERDGGTMWGPYWCPDHDSQRLERIEHSLESIAQTIAERLDERVVKAPGGDDD